MRQPVGVMVACVLASFAVLGVVAPAEAAGSAAIRACVERGGTYLEDGTCEVMVADDAARRCRRRGGRYLGNGRCETVTEDDPVERCRQAGGVLMHQGRCYFPGSR